MNCHDGEKTTRNRQAALSSVKSSVTGHAFFVHLRKLRHPLPLLFLSLRPFRQLLSTVGLIRRVLQQHPGLLFIIFVCHLECGSSLVAKATETPEHVPLRWQLVRRAYFAAATLPPCRRRWASLLCSCSQDKYIERRFTTNGDLKIRVRSRKPYLDEKRLRSPPSGSAEVFPEPSSPVSYENSSHCNSSSVARLSHLRDVYAFHFQRCGSLPVTSPLHSCVKVLGTCEPTCAVEVQQNAPLRDIPLKDSLRDCLKHVSDRIVRRVYRCPRIKGLLHNANVVQSESELSTTAWLPAFLCRSPAATCAFPEAEARAVNSIVHRSADTAIFKVNRGISLRHALGKRDANALSATATVTVLPERASRVNLHTGYWKSAHTKVAAGVVPLLQSALRLAVFFVKGGCDRTSVMKQEPFLPMTSDESREGRYLVSLKELERDAFVEEEIKSTAALSQKERLASVTAVDSGECSSKGKKERRQRDYLPVGKRRENKPGKQGKKEIRLTPRIAAHDLCVKAKQARQFLLEKKQVLFSVHLRGRELAACSLHRVLLERVAEMLNDVAAPANAIQQKGNTLTQLFQNRKQRKSAPDPQMHNEATVREGLSSAAPSTACPETGWVNRESA